MAVAVAATSGGTFGIGYAEFVLMIALALGFHAGLTKLANREAKPHAG